MQAKPLCVTDIADKINSGKYFTFVRYGDGEFNAIDGKRGQNCDRHQYFPAMGAELKATIVRPVRDQNYYYGFQTETDLLKRKSVQDIVGKSNLDIYDADVFHKASEKGELNPLVRALRAKRVCIIGPERLDKISRVFPCDTVRVRLTDAYVEMPITMRRILRYHTKYPEDVVYGFSAGMSTEIMIHKLYNKIGKRNWMIDFGSLWDVYIGVYSRKYHSRIAPEIIKENIK